MGEKLSLGTQIRELKLGASFRNPKSTGFHTVRYDFKPASVDVNKSATIDVGTNNQITVTVPHLDGAGTSQTVFKGSQKPYQKECVLIIDKITGEITLERLSSNIQVKKTRSESTHKPLPTSLLNDTKQLPVNTSVNSNKLITKLGKKGRKDHHTTNLTVTKNSPRHLSPAHNSPARSRSPLLKVESVATTKSASASPIAPSLPFIGFDDFSSTKTANDKSPYNNKSYKFSSNVSQAPLPQLAASSADIVTSNTKTSPVGVTLSDSSSSSSSSSDESGSESDTNSKSISHQQSYSASNDVKVSDSSDSDTDDDSVYERTAIGKTPSKSSTSLSMPNPTQVPDHLLNEDLRLSESGSDSD